MKATTLLQNQHRQVESLFEAIEKSDPANRRQLVEELATALAAHMVIEEETFYPMTMNIARALIPVNQEEHEAAASTLQRAVGCPQDDQLLIARVRVLRALVEMHVAKEEGELFPAVEGALDDAQLQAMGQQMESRFQQLIKLSPQAVISARPTAGVPCPGQPQQLGQQQPGQQQPTNQHTSQQQPDQQQPGQQQPGQQPGQQRPGQAKGRPGTRRTR